MAPNELTAYIEGRRKEGFSDDRIRTVLQTAGYAVPDVEAALREANAVPPPIAPRAEGGSFAPPAEPSQAGKGMNAPAAGASVAPPATPTANPSKIKRVIIFSVVGIIVLGVITAVAYAYFFAPSPQKVMAAMIQNGFSGAHSMHIDSDLALEINIQRSAPVSTSALSAPATGAFGNSAAAYANAALGNASGTVNFSAHTSGSYDWSDSTDPKTDTSASLTLGFSSPGQNASFSAAGEVRVIGQTLYAELTQAPALGFFDASPYENQWVSIGLNSSTLNQLNAGSMIPTSTLASSSLSSSDIQSIESALQGAVQIVKTLPGETMDGIATYHYQYAISKSGVENLVATFTSIGHVSSTVSAQAVSHVGDILGAVESMGGEIWIGKSDYYPRQISFDLSFATTTNGYALDGTVNATSSFSSVNQPQNIVAPPAATDLDQFLSGASASSSLPTFPE